MEAVVLCGVQGGGKTTLYRDRFLETRQRFVVDATNPTPADRRRYVEPARAANFKVVGYLVGVDDVEALARNAERSGRRRVPAAGLVGTARRLLAPTPEEGFDELWHATAAPGGGWRIEPLLTTRPLPGL